MATTTPYAGYSDIDISLKKQPDADVRMLIDIDAVNASLLNIVKTMQGQRRMLPTFAFGAYNILFEQMTDNTSERLGNALVTAIKQWEDRVDLINVHVLAAREDHLYHVTLSYSIKALGSATVFTLPFILQQL